MSLRLGCDISFSGTCTRSTADEMNRRQTARRMCLVWVVVARGAAAHEEEGGGGVRAMRLLSSSQELMKSIESTSGAALCGFAADLRSRWGCW